MRVSTVVNWYAGDGRNKFAFIHTRVQDRSSRREGYTSKLFSCGPLKAYARSQRSRSSSLRSFLLLVPSPPPYSSSSCTEFVGCLSGRFSPSARTAPARPNQQAKGFDALTPRQRRLSYYTPRTTQECPTTTCPAVRCVCRRATREREYFCGCCCCCCRRRCGAKRRLRRGRRQRTCLVTLLLQRCRRRHRRCFLLLRCLLGRNIF